MKSMQLIICLILLLVSSLSFSQPIKTYETEWKKVEGLIKQKNLSKSALEEVRKIYALAKAEKQESQVVKALVYIGLLQQENRENNEILGIQEIEKEMAQQQGTTLAILQSLLADRYWDYFQQHRWQLYSRTATVQFKKEDIATWSAEDLHKKISTLYLQSLANKTVLQSTKLDAYDAIIIKGNVRPLRPTLFDLLVHKALLYFKNNERDIKKPAYAFEITQIEAFAPASKFVSTSFPTKDTSSLHHKALLIYQELLLFHLNDKDPAALIDADIARLQFVYQNAVIDSKDSLYQQALEALIQKWTGSATAQAQYLLAAYYVQLAANYHPLKDTSHRFARLQAKALLESVIKDSATKNEGWSNSYNLLQEINRPSYQFEVEKVNVPGQPFRALVTYRNTGTLFLRLVKADANIKKVLQNLYNDKQWDVVTSATPMRSWQQALPATNDLQEHATEIKIDALPTGEYLLLASSDDNFSKKSRLGAQLFYVSNISYIHQDNRFFVVHRESGQPINNATVEVYKQVYDYKANGYNKQKTGTYKTDRNGFVEIAQTDTKNQYNYSLAISSSNDSLNLNDQLYSGYHHNDYNPQRPNKHIFFFTDRSLYRPGQTVFTKGIVMEKGKNSNQIITNYRTTLLLRNANGELVDSLSVTTNDFGSFNGKFTLPQNVLNGSFQIVDKEGWNYTEFAVEEYKRPRFAVNFEKVKDMYKVGDTIIVMGSAKAYAGNNIDGAKVRYRVVRQPRFLYPWLTWHWWLPPSEPMEIAHGETTTDREGKFTIHFAAIPDRKIDRKLEPVFDYLIYTDVTDINGETRSGDNKVSAGYKSTLLKVTIPEKVAVDSIKTIQVRAENMSGAYQPSIITLTVSKLLPEQRLIRPRFWQQPDQFVMSKEEYLRLFPYDEYQGESDSRNWTKGETVYTQSDSTRVNGEWAINSTSLKAGYYTLEFTTKDKDGQEVKDIRVIEIFDLKSKELARPEYIWTKKTDNPIEPGEKTNVLIGSSAEEVFVVQEVDKRKEEKSENTAFHFSHLNNEKKLFEYGATETDRGSYGVNFFFVKHNRFFQSANVIMVPWTNKETSISYSTFRDKLLPGAEEKWEVKLSGHKGERAAAEVLASMYDASLDQFKPHTWDKPNIWPVYNKRLAWQGQQNFSAIQSQQRWINEKDYKTIDKRYDYFFFDNNVQGIILGGRPGAPTTVRIRGNTTLNAEFKQSRDANMAAPPLEEALAGKAASIAADAQNVAAEDIKEQVDIPNSDPIQIRKNLNETAFFLPELRTDAAGNISFSFTTPEALTRWKLQLLSHTKELAFGLSEKEVVTQKELMVQPNLPRFLRQGDKMELTAKVVNLSDKEFTGQAELQLVDVATNQSVDGWFINMFPNQYFTVAAGQSEVVRFPIEVPYTFTGALGWRIVAKAGNFSDGEEAAIPVLTNKTLVTESLLLPMRSAGTKTFVFDKLKNVTSETLQHQSLTVEYTSNPTWYAVQALPYLMESKEEHAEQIWNRYYANALAQKIVNAAPRIKQIFGHWKTIDTATLLSNLQKNEELKTALLEETPWVLAAKTETQQKKNIALLFDLVRMNSELKASLQKLKELQSSNGGFVWIKGAPDDRYMTQYIVTGIGRLKQLGAITPEHNDDLKAILNMAIPYLDRQLKEDYDRLVQSKADRKTQPAQPIQAQYLYMRSFFKDITIAKATLEAYIYYRNQAQQHWIKSDKYTQGLIALALHRTGDNTIPTAILRSLKERAISNEELGMYWKDNAFGYSWYWWHAPIETQSLMIEAFNEIGEDTKTVDDLRLWLIKNKQTNNWRTTKATADACYAMLLQGTEWLTNSPVGTIQLGTTSVSSTSGTEAGTGYFKKMIEPQYINKEMGNIKVTVSQPTNSSNQSLNAPSWGAVYWQYFENLDKIITAATPLQLSKKLFIERNTDRGPVLTPITDGTTTAVGEKVKVRIELRVDRDMEYVHMKDLRSSGLEPINVLSGYKWQGGLGYYETTKDVSTSFFFPYLRKGTYVFEYPLFVSHTGNFSNGITTIQCLYAPEFNAHSEGVRLKVE